jgi:hypothetical protein
MEREMVVVEENRKALISLISPIGGGAIRAVAVSECLICGG